MIRHTCPARRPAEPNGFTLIEMLVALSVFSIAALALLRLDSYAVATTADLDARAAAQLVLYNQAALIASDPAAPIRGTTSIAITNGGRNFVATRKVTPTDDSRLVRVDMAVRETGGTGRAAMTIVRRIP